MVMQSKRLILLSLVLGFQLGTFMSCAPGWRSSIPVSVTVCGVTTLAAAALGGSALSAQMWHSKAGKKIERDITLVSRELKRVRYAIKHAALIEFELREYQEKEHALKEQLDTLLKSRPLIVRVFGGSKSGVTPQIAAGLWAAFGVAATSAMASGVWASRNYRRAAGIASGQVTPVGNDGDKRPFEAGLGLPVVVDNPLQQ
jgi:hypothetical protein